MKAKVFIWTFSPGEEVGWYAADWIGRAAAKLKHEYGCIVGTDRLKGTPIPMLRNKALFESKQMGCDFAIMIDSDMRPDPEHPDVPQILKYRHAKPFLDEAWPFMLRNPQAAAVFAPYCGPSPINNIYVFRWRSNHNRFNRPGSTSLHQYSREEAAVMGGIEEVAAGPTGLVIYNVKRCTEMPCPWFYYEYKDKEQTAIDSTEDVTQTRDLSLRYHATGGVGGGKVYCAWDSWAIHRKYEDVDKPELATVEAVAEGLRNAIKRDLKQDDKLVNVDMGRVG